jgi:uroporphyrinogen decarboxylase
MAEMTTYERVRRMYEHRDADRIPVTDDPWSSTVERWHREGMPENVSVEDYFGLDKFGIISVDNSPQYPEGIVEKTPEYVIETTRWGTTLRNWAHAGGVPEFLHHTIVDPASWAAAKARMVATPDRIPWDYLKQNYKQWRDEGRWLRAILWFGFDVTHSWTIGTERMLMALVQQPEWCVDMFNHLLDVNIALLDRVWDAGYTFDEAMWWDDMGYKGHQFFSMRTYRDLLKPAHRRAIEWAHSKGIKIQLHSCGNINPFLPELVDMGLDMLNPLEVKAGMDPVALKQRFGDRLAFHGGLNAVLYTEPEKLWEEMRHVIPAMKVNGGYMASSDHSVPDSVSLETFRCFVELAKELGSYE